MNKKLMEFYGVSFITGFLAGATIQMLELTIKMYKDIYK